MLLSICKFKLFCYYKPINSFGIYILAYDFSFIASSSFYGEIKCIMFSFVFIWAHNNVWNFDSFSFSCMYSNFVKRTIIKCGLSYFNRICGVFCVFYVDNSFTYMFLFIFSETPRQTY